MSEPIVVVGTGRCGTSTVAKWLTHFDVSMGLRFSNEMNPGLEPGFWEDLDFKELNQSRPEIGPIEFQQKLHSLIEEKRKRSRWGIKDPRIANPLVFSHYLDLLPKALYVHCFRPIDDCADSWVRSWPGQDPLMVLRTLESRNKILSQTFEAASHLKVLFLHFDAIKSGEGKARLMEAVVKHYPTGERDEDHSLDAEGVVRTCSNNSGVSERGDESGS